jgi:hypothetical protein
MQLLHNSHLPWFFRTLQTKVQETHKLLTKLLPPIIVRKLPIKRQLKQKSFTLYHQQTLRQRE